jgi:exonuclease III
MLEKIWAATPGIFQIIAIFLFVSACPASGGQCIKIASYNLENLFDLRYDGTEYQGYIPGGKLGWNCEMMERKLDNLSRVIDQLGADVIGLQEVESARALERLSRSLKERGINYPYSAIADLRSTTVKCALLSKFPVIDTKEIHAERGSGRSILRADLTVYEKRLVVFVNHWKSKTGPESMRLACARALAQELDDLPEDTDYVLLGDFNSNYNEYKTIAGRKSLNDTGGITGINHVLNTLYAGLLVDEKQLTAVRAKKLHYNLWLELPEKRRWSVLFWGRPGSPDAILLPASLYDDKGLSYLDNSFDRFDPGYLFENGKIRRWKRADRGKGRHLGHGYSDHLPVYACLTTGPFSFRAAPWCQPAGSGTVDIKALYKSKTGEVNLRLRNCAVIYRHDDNAVIKQDGGRAVYVYGTAGGLKKGQIYDLTVTRLKRFYGNLEITALKDLQHVKTMVSEKTWYVSGPEADLGSPALENEVISSYDGRYVKGMFYYGDKKQIRLYFRDKSLKPKTSGPVRISRARIGLHQSPELVIEKPSQIMSIYQ